MESKTAGGRHLNIVTAIKYLFEKKLFTDFTLLSKDKGKEFKVHKLVLSIHSTVLSDIFSGDCNCKSIEITNVSDVAIENMVRYFYDETVDLENLSQIKETKKLAERYEIFGLNNICISRLSDINVDISNVLNVFETAVEFKNETKEAECLMLINKNKELISSEQMKTISFKNIFQLLDKLRTRNLINEAEFLNLGLQWLEINNCMHKTNLLLEKAKLSKLSMNEFIDIIISYPEFFNNKEISRTMKEIKSRREVDFFRNKGTNTESKAELHRDIGTNTETESALYRSIGTNTACKMELNRNIGTNTDSELVLHRSIGTNTEEEETKESKILEKEYTPRTVKQISLRTLTTEDGGELLSLNDDLCIIAVHDDFGVRRLITDIPENYRKGIIDSAYSPEEPTEHVFYDVRTSFEGIVIYINKFMLDNCDSSHQSITALQHLEVLEAAFFFQIQELTDKIIAEICTIVEYDPLFLDGLRYYDCLQDRFKYFLDTDPRSAFFHTNIYFITFKLLVLLLQQKKTHSNDCCVLLDVIEWLENRNLVQSHSRNQLLNLIWFQNISMEDFKCVVWLHPDFFSSEEKESISAYKSADLAESLLLVRNLPKWYSFERGDLSSGSSDEDSGSSDEDK